MLSPRVNSRTDRAILRWPVGVARELGPPRPALGAREVRRFHGRSYRSTGAARSASSSQREPGPREGCGERSLHSHTEGIIHSLPWAVPQALADQHELDRARGRAKEPAIRAAGLAPVQPAADERLTPNRRSTLSIQISQRVGDRSRRQNNPLPFRLHPSAVARAS